MFFNIYAYLHSLVLILKSFCIEMWNKITFIEIYKALEEGSLSEVKGGCLRCARNKVMEIYFEDFF